MRLKNALMALFTTGLCVMAALEVHIAITNVVLFFSWFLLVCFCIFFAAPEGKDGIIKQLRKNKDKLLPEWYSRLNSFTRVVVFAAVGWWVTAAVWVIIWMLESKLKEEALKG